MREDIFKRRMTDMRVFQINTVCGYGSTGRIAVDLAKHIERRGAKCEIAYGRFTKDPNYQYTYYIGNSLDHYLHGLYSRITDRQGFYSNIATQELIKEIRRYNPDIIHLHNLHGYYLNVSSLFKYLCDSNKPVVWTLHDCWPFTGHCTYFDIAQCNKWTTQCKHCVQKSKYPSSYFRDNSENNYNTKKAIFSSCMDLHIVTPSKWLGELVSKSFLADIDRRVINNGINLDKFHPTKSGLKQRLGIEGKKVLLGVASRWGDRKGYGDFIKLSRYIHDNYIIVMVGVDDKQIEELPKNVLGIKRTESIEELCELYSLADYYLNLTYEDNFPTTNIEALACGTPVITYRTGGSTESVDELSGVVIEKGNIEEIVAIIDSVTFDRNECRNRALLFNSEDRYEDYFNLYEELI